MSVPTTAASSEASSGQRPELSKVASGQRLVLQAVVLNILAVVLRVLYGDVAFGLAAVVAFVFSLVGLNRLASGLGYSVGSRILLMVLMLIPLINLITLLVLNSSATKILRAGGYKVGLMGASRGPSSG